MLQRTPICVLAKSPQPGLAKTRLAQRVGADTAAALAQAFLEDTWNGLQALTWAQPVLALAEGPRPVALEGAEIWSQGKGDLGQRLMHVLSRALELAPCALAMGSDTPGLPHVLLEHAARALQDHDAVIGPAEDGGFYLLGLRACSLGLLDGLPWSTAETCALTEKRLKDRGFTVATISRWFDIDEHADLVRLIALLEAGALSAPRTLAVARARSLARAPLEGAIDS